MRAIDLPQGYLSYSAWNMWRKNKNAFRKRYYFRERPFETVESMYGKNTAKLMENEEEVRKHPVLKNIPRFEVREFPVRTALEGITLLGYIDSFDPTKKAFRDLKTGHDPWDKVRVAKLDQLPFYSLLIEMTEGRVQNRCFLDWAETRFKEKTMEFGEHVLTAQTRELELTGRIETFERIIYKWEREKMKEDIITAAYEISEDYGRYKEKLL